MEIQISNDASQDKKIIEIPEIRVWCHPERIGEPGTKYFETFKGFKRALEFINAHKKLTDIHPLVAFKGYEINLFKIKTKQEIEEKEKKKEKIVVESKVIIKEKEVKENEKSKN